MRFFFGVCLLFLFCSNGFAHQADPVVVNVTMTPQAISISPNIISENTPFVIHLINKSGAPIELENSDTSVEVYPGMDKTFRVGLPAGEYVFFNDFNSKTKTAGLVVKPAGEVIPKSTSKPSAPTDHAEITPHLQGTEIVFIVWRESVEALLIVGIVYNWLKRTKSDRSGMYCLGLGVIVGLLCTVILSSLLIKISSILNGDGQSYLQVGMTLLAAVMIVYMVKWMREHGRHLKTAMQSNLTQSSSTRWFNFSILFVVAVAIAREGSEAAIFIYALGFGVQGTISVAMLGMLALGLGLAILTIYILQLSNQLINWRNFFRITEVLLLLLGGGLLLHAVDLLSSQGVLPVLFPKIWDTSFLIADGSAIAPMFSSFIGYHATPSLLDLLAYLGYWVIVYLLMFKKTTLPPSEKSPCVP